VASVAWRERGFKPIPDEEGTAIVHSRGETAIIIGQDSFLPSITEKFFSRFELANLG
jgi:hypothetical protein